MRIERYSFECLRDGPLRSLYYCTLVFVPQVLGSAAIPVHWLSWFSNGSLSLSATVSSHSGCRGVGVWELARLGKVRFLRVCCLIGIWRLFVRSNPFGGPQGILGFCCVLLAGTLLRWSIRNSILVQTALDPRALVGFVLCRFFVVYRIALPSCGVGDRSANGCFLAMHGKGVRRYKLRGYTLRITLVLCPTGAGVTASYTCPLVVMVLQWAPPAECDGSVSLR